MDGMAWRSLVQTRAQRPACERDVVNPNRPQKSWRTAWRSLVQRAAKCAGRSAAECALEAGAGICGAIAAWKRAATPFRGLRFHDLRHQAITELAESGASDSTIIALAGHVSRAMMEHYSHTRMEAKRAAVEGLSTGLIESGVVKQGAYTGLRHKTRHKGSLQSCALSVSA
jgi:hypothetical protein